MFINYGLNQIDLKIVYYGPALGGKTTNLVQVHGNVQTAQGSKGKLVSLATSSDRTLFFDFLPIEAVAIKGYKTKFPLSSGDPETSARSASRALATTNSPT